MNFSDKLSKLLSLTETSNSMLARKVLLDPSQVSRMRTGARGRPGNLDIIWDMSAYFSSRCESEYRMSALVELTGDSRILTNRSDRVICECIFAWLIADNNSGHVASFERKESFSTQVSALPYHTKNIIYNEQERSNTFVGFTDNAGKRQAVLDMFDLLLTMRESRELYLFSDEDSDWLYEDKDFLDKISQKISALANKGWLFYRMDTMSYSLERGFDNVNVWLSAYACGAVREHYYPHLRDELHRRTLFVCPDTVSVYARSLAGQKQSRLTAFCTEQSVVNVCYQEVLDIFRLCKPMIKVYSYSEADDLFRRLRLFEGAEGNCIYKHAGLPVALLPEEICSSLAKTYGIIPKRLAENIRIRTSLRNTVVKQSAITDVICLADAQSVIDGKIPVAGCSIMGGRNYNAREYKHHLENLIKTLEQESNYNVIISNEPIWDNVCIYAKEQGEVLIVKDTSPFILLEVMESRLSANFCDYIAKKCPPSNKSDSIATLKNLANQL